MMKAPKGMPQGDPEFIKKATLCLIVWLVVFLILLMADIKVGGIEIDRLWLALPFLIIAIFIAYIIVGIVLYQTKAHFPNFFDNLPIWIKEILSPCAGVFQNPHYSNPARSWNTLNRVENLSTFDSAVY